MNPYPRSAAFRGIIRDSRVYAMLEWARDGGDPCSPEEIAWYTSRARQIARDELDRLVMMRIPSLEKNA